VAEKVPLTAALVSADVRHRGETYLIERRSIRCGTRTPTIADMPLCCRPLDSSPAAAAPAELIASVPAMTVLGPALDALSREAAANLAKLAAAAPQAVVARWPGAGVEAARLLGLRRTMLQWAVWRCWLQRQIDTPAALSHGGRLRS
jgi:hypothetical protein